MPPAPPRTSIPTLSKLDLVLETSRLRLRPLTEADVDAIWPYVSDPAFPALMSWSAHTQKSETQAWIALTQQGTTDGKSVTWGIEQDGKVIGCVGLDGIAFQLRAWRIDRAELGYWLAPAAWSKGIMTEAATAVVRAGFEVIGLHKVTVGCLAQNEASRRVIEKLGFRYVGRLEDDVWRDGQWHSHLRFELTAPEWPDVHTTMRMDRRAVLKPQS